MIKIMMSIMFLIFQFPVLTFAQELWTLKDTVTQVLEKSYVLRSAGAEVSARQSDLSHAGAWPNPSVELNVNEKLGYQDNSGGYDLTEISISQPIPLGRLSRQQKESKAKLQAAQHNLSYQQLLQEVETAHWFHMIQLKKAQLDLAQEQIKFSKDYQKDGVNNSKNKIVRYLTPLDQKRLNIIFANSNQEALIVEGEYSEALFRLKTLLQLSSDASYFTTELKPILLTTTLEDVIGIQKQQHPAIMAFRYQEKAAEAGIALAWGELFPDPSLKVFRETDTFDEGRKGFYGVAINFEIPIWDFKRGSIAKAKHEAQKVKYDLKVLEQEFKVRLHEKYLHLERLLKQTEHYKNNILIPSQEVLELTKSSFNAGEVDVLNFIDAHKTYFDARNNYLELLYEASMELAQVRLAAGISLLDQKDFNSNRSIGGQ